MWSLLFLHLGSTFRNSALCDAAGIEWQQSELLNWLFTSSRFLHTDFPPVRSRCRASHTPARLCFNSEFVSIRIALKHTMSQCSLCCILSDLHDGTSKRLLQKRSLHWALIFATFTSVHWTRQNSEWCGRSWIWGLISISHYPLHNFGQEASPTSASIFLSVKWGQWHILVLQLWQDFSRNNEMGCEACKALALLAGGHTLCWGTWPEVSPPVSSPAPRGCRTCPIQMPRSRDLTAWGGSPPEQ